MTTHAQLPNAFGPPAAAIGAAIVGTAAMSGGRGNVGDGIFLVAALAAVILSARYTLRTYRQLAALEFRPANTFRWIGVALAFILNGVEMLVMILPLLLLVGMLFGGRGIS
jgi:uncharacterized membrane protein